MNNLAVDFKVDYLDSASCILDDELDLPHVSPLRVIAILFFLRPTTL